MSRTVVVGTYDSKAEPLETLTGMLAKMGAQVTTIDVGVFPSGAATSISADQVAAAAGRRHADIGRLDRAEAVSIMTAGAAEHLNRLFAADAVSALVMMGGSNAAAIFARLTERLPTGIPKIFMGTFVSGDTRAMINARDVVLLYPIVDVDGSNAILDAMIERLARTAVALSPRATLLRPDAGQRSRVALSMYGVTTPCVQALRARIDADGAETLVFHANGTGGRSIEAFASEGLIDAVADITLAELCNEVLGGGFPAGPDRMTGAARAGVPQIIVPGAADMIAFGPPETVPERFANHRTHAHNALVTLVRTTPGECRAVGRELSRRLGKPRAATTLCVPMGGVSMLDREGAVFHDPGAIEAFVEGFSERADSSIRIIAADDNVNDPPFAERLYGELQKVRRNTAAQEGRKP